MIKLIKLEWKKNNIGKYFKIAFVLTFLLCIFIFALAYLGIANDPDTGVPDAAVGKSGISASTELFTSMSYLIFTSAMLSSFIVNAYKNKTMYLMFTYPISRRKILVSQMLAVWSFSFVASVVTKLLIYTTVLVGSLFKQPFFLLDFDMASPGFYILILIRSALTVTMSFIALFVGIRTSSSKAALITSFLLIFLTQANIGDFTMAGNIALPMVLTAVSLAFAFFSVFKVEAKDI